MTLATLIHQAETEGVSLTLSVEGKLKAAGKQHAISRWLPFIQQHKPEIIQTLRAANDEPAKEPPSQQEQADLARLVARVCRAYDCPDTEISQAIETALADYWEALTCYTDLARKAGMALKDDKPMCFECAELSGSYCMAARRGELPNADRRYEPMKYQPKRCQGFKSKMYERN